MSVRSERPAGWFKLSTAFYADGKILPVSLGAEVLFVRMLALASGASTGGMLTTEQILHVAHKIRSVQKCIDELVAAELLVPALHPTLVDCPECWEQTPHQCAASAALVQGQCSTSAGLVQVQCRGCAGLVQHQCTPSAGLVQGYRISAYRRWNLAADEPAAQRAQSNHDDRNAHARGPARERKTERKKETVTSRPASPDGRDVTVARAAPRRVQPDAPRHAPGQFEGAVREAPDFAGPRRVADSDPGDKLLKADTLRRLTEWDEGRQQNGNSGGDAE